MGALCCLTSTIFQVALEKLKLEQVNWKDLYPPSSFLALEPFFSHQDVTGETENDTKKKKDVARLLKTALGVELKEKLIGVWCS